MRIAVSSQNLRTITGHAGKTRRFLVYEVAAGGEAVEIERLDLPTEMTLHAYQGDQHPLFQLGLDALVTASAGPRFVERMAAHGVRVIATAETDIAAALAALAAGRPLPEAPPHEH